MGSELEAFLEEPKTEAPTESASAESSTPDASQGAADEPTQLEMPETQGDDSPPEKTPSVAAEKAEESPATAEEGSTSQASMVPLTALLDEREKRQKMEARLRDVESQIPKEDAKSKAEIPDVVVDPEGYRNYMEERFQAMETNTRITMSRQVMTAMHDDYDQREQEFLSLANDNPALAQQMAASDMPAKFVYETALKAEKAKRMENVDEWEATERARIREEERAKLKAEFEEQAQSEAATAAALQPSLASVSGAGSNKAVARNVPDPLETTFKR